MSCPHGKQKGRCRECRLDALEDFYGDGSQHYDEKWPGLDASQKKAKPAADSGGDA